MLNNRHLKFARGIQGRVEYNTATRESAAKIVVEPEAVQRYVIKFVIISFAAYKFFWTRMESKLRRPSRWNQFRYGLKKNLSK